MRCPELDHHGAARKCCMQMEMEMLQINKLHISGTMFLVYRNLAPLKEMEMQTDPL